VTAREHPVIAVAVPAGPSAAVLQTVRRLDDAGAHLAILARHGLGSADPLTLLGALAASTAGIGLAAAMSPWQQPPFLAARAFATADAMSGGRAAWYLEHDMAAEAMFDDSGRWTSAGASEEELAAATGDYLDAVGGLWDSWEPDAMIVDTASGRYVDAAKVHVLDHRGPYFATRGPLNMPRSPQGRPVLIGRAGPQAPDAARLDVLVVEDRQQSRQVRARWEDAGRPDGVVLAALPLRAATVPGILAQLEATSADGVLVEDFAPGRDAGILLHETSPALAAAPSDGLLRDRLGLAPEGFENGFAKTKEAAL
jgi:alkanesulfonate monooxygenase SsuD/methylene tetrahydromethanopterin reductase-like flavin-dependent oxidoreductase (luciferase family)